MKIKQLQSLPWPDLEIQESNESVDFYFTTASHKIGGDTVLELRLYTNTAKYKNNDVRRRARTFLSKNEERWFTQFVKGEIDRSVLGNVLQTMLSRYISPYSCYPWPATEQDERRLLRFIRARDTQNHGFEKLQNWQLAAEQKHREEREERAKQLLFEKMEACPIDIPEWFYVAGWLGNQEEPELRV